MRNVLTRPLPVFVAFALAGCGFSDLNNNSLPNPPPPTGYAWSSQNSQTISKLRDVFFINSNQGWVVGDSLTLLSTTNGGLQWPQVPATNTVRNLMSAFFVDAKTGWVAGGTGAIDGGVYISKMGGAYPTQQQMVNRPLNTIFFLDKDTGWAAGDSSILIHTDNGGVSWTSSTIGAKDKVFDVQFLNSELGWAATNPDGIYRTKDGVIWTKEDLGTVTDIRGLHFVDTLHGWACGSGNTILKRELSSAQTPIWTKSSISSEPGSIVWNDIFFINEQTGWIVGTGGSVYKTIDGGTSWTKESASAQTNLNAVYMINGSKGWIVGDGGNILTYTP